MFKICQNLLEIDNFMKFGEAIQSETGNGLLTNFAVAQTYQADHVHFLSESHWCTTAERNWELLIISVLLGNRRSVETWGINAPFVSLLLASIVHLEWKVSRNHV